MILRDNDPDRQKKLNLYKEIYPLVEKDFNELDPYAFENKYLQIRQDWKASDQSNNDTQLKYEVSVAIFEEFMENNVGRKPNKKEDDDGLVIKIKRPPTIKK